MWATVTTTSQPVPAPGAPTPASSLRALSAEPSKQPAIAPTRPQRAGSTATMRSGAPVPPPIFIGNAITVAPRAGDRVADEDRRRDGRAAAHRRGTAGALRSRRGDGWLFAWLGRQGA